MTLDEALALLYEASELLVELSVSSHDKKAVLDARDLARRIDDVLVEEDWTPQGREVKPIDAIYDDYLAKRIDKDELKRRLAALDDDR
jgi:hypothetical protein